MRFDFIIIFPRIFDSYFNESILGRAQEKKLISIHTHDLRKWTTDKHRTVDDKPYGGGAGMVLKAEPILAAVDAVKKKSKIKSQGSKVVVFSAKGKPFDQKLAHHWAKKFQQLIFVSGRYEGIDERVVNILKAEEISIGPYVLTDGDVAAMVVVSAVSRLIPGVLGCAESLLEESHSIPKTYNLKPKTSIEYPHYTRPEIIIYKRKKYRVPKALLSGNPKKISDWREKHR